MPARLADTRSLVGRLRDLCYACRMRQTDSAARAGLPRSMKKEASGASSGNACTACTRSGRSHGCDASWLPALPSSIGIGPASGEAGAEVPAASESSRKALVALQPERIAQALTGFPNARFPKRLSVEIPRNRGN